ncbi:LacI family transcriptional regulator [Bacillus cereus]|nr:LacI family transcriptional regulator [Bacillus cereus]PGU68927.1 LacI family transcriptional regulator [Bacillus cereus]
MVTIKDVAQLAKVSKGTVSNVLSRKRPISKEVQERVLEAARQLNYRPNYLARSLAIQQTGIISLNMPMESTKFSPFHFSLLNGVLNECSERGYRVLVNRLSNGDEFRPSDPIDGEIILDPSESDPRIKERQEQKMPFILVGKPPKKFEKSISYVDNDNIQIALQVTDYLLSLGHKHILFLNAPKERTVSQERWLGYKMALEEKGYTTQQHLVHFKTNNLPSFDFAYEKTTMLLDKLKEITAIITDSNHMAMGVYQAARDKGLHIPDDLSVISFSNDINYVNHFNPPLSCANLKAELLGKEAAKMLLDQLSTQDKVIKRVMISSDFMDQGSCKSII